jgi:hypothetical protein
MIGSGFSRGLVLAALTLTGGCTTTIVGQGEGPAAVGTPVSATSPPCTDITYSDPTIAFESALTDGAQLAVGETGWIRAAGSARDVQVTGNPGTVALADRSVATHIACGEVLSSASWIEITAKRPGTAILAVPGNSTATITLVVG